MRKDTENFIDSAEYDLSIARHLLETGRYVYVLFMCHLSIEKILKAIVTETIETLPPKIHNLLHLIKLAKIEVPQNFLDFISQINNASVVTRYPSDIKKLQLDYTQEQAKIHLQKTEEVIEWLKQNQKLKRL